MGRFVTLAVVCLPLGLVAEEVKITDGPILGRVSPTGMGIWARTSRAGEFRVRYGKTPDSMDQVSNPATTDVGRDNSGVVQLDGLSPATTYYYELLIGEERFPGGSFRTLASADQFKHPELNPKGLFNFRFEFACGNNQNEGQGSGPELPAFRTMLRQLKGRIDFAILNGDWLYEVDREYSPAQWREQVGVSEQQQPRIVTLAPTIVGVWQNYKTFLRQGGNLRAWHRHIPSFFTFDDHEILNDVWGAGSPGLRDRRAVFRDVGVQAWYDYLGWSNPSPFKQGIRFGTTKLTAGEDVLVDNKAEFSKLDLGQAATLHVHWGGDTAGVNDNALDEVGGEPAAGVYAIEEVLDDHKLRIRPAPKHDGEVTYSIGRRSYYRFRISNCDFFCLDTRTHREMHDTKNPSQPDLSMLGRGQKSWLLNGVRSSDADFIFVVSSVNFMVPHVGGGKVRTTNKDDAWTVFFDEREQLIKEFDAIGKPVFVLTGDLHNSFVIKITDRVWEFASGPHNSNNHWYTDEGARPASGKFQYGPRACDIRWSTFFRNDIPRDQLLHPTFCVVQINNVFNNPLKLGKERWVAFERPQVVFQYFDGRTGELRYSESVVAVR